MYTHAKKKPKKLDFWTKTIFFFSLNFNLQCA